MIKKIFLTLLALGLPAIAGAESAQMVAVSADIVEISGSIQKTRGFSWNQFFDFSEKTIPGIITVGDFERKTALAASLKLLETEGKAQMLSNPKIITKSGTQANFTVGGEIPVPYSNNQGVGAEFKKYGVILNVLPVVLTEKKDTVDVQIQLEVSNPNYSQTVVASGTTRQGADAGADQCALPAATDDQAGHGAARGADPDALPGLLLLRVGREVVHGSAARQGEGGRRRHKQGGRAMHLDHGTDPSGGG